MKARYLKLWSHRTGLLKQQQQETEHSRHAERSEGVASPTASAAGRRVPATVWIAAGVAALTSAFPAWHLNRVELGLGFVLLLMLGNLRGIRESGRIFAAPTYFFIFSFLLLLGTGVHHVVTGRAMPVVPPIIHENYPAIPIFLLLLAIAALLILQRLYMG